MAFGRRNFRKILIMKRKLFWLVAVTFFTFQCSHYDELQRNGKESASGDDESHNFGLDCMSCHNIKPSEAYREGGWWRIAGSVANEDGSGPFTNATIELWSEPDRSGVLYYTLQVDAKGNFYTEKIVDYNGTCFPAVVNNETGEYESMNQAYHAGGCNSCHGITEELIHVDE